MGPTNTTTIKGRKNIVINWDVAKTKIKILDRFLSGK